MKSHFTMLRVHNILALMTSVVATDSSIMFLEVHVFAIFCGWVDLKQSDNTKLPAIFVSKSRCLFDQGFI
jgi:hypothetical protein